MTVFADVLGTLVKLSELDRPAGIQLEVLKTVQNMVVLLDEQFLVHSVVHRAVLRLLKTCCGDEIQEQLDGRNRLMGAAGNAIRTPTTEYEEDCACARLFEKHHSFMILYSGGPLMSSVQPHTDVQRTPDDLLL